MSIFRTYNGTLGAPQTSMPRFALTFHGGNCALLHTKWKNTQCFWLMQKTNTCSFSSTVQGLWTASLYEYGINVTISKARGFRVSITTLETYPDFKSWYGSSTVNIPLNWPAFPNTCIERKLVQKRTLPRGTLPRSRKLTIGQFC